jgi:HEAT repeat protein
VARAFQAARQGDNTLAAGLQDLGTELIPLLSPYLQDSHEEVRSEVVALLRGVRSDATWPLLIQAMVDPSQDIKERATLALYEQYDPLQLARSAPAGQALRQSVAGGNHSAAALLLLGYFPGPDTEKLLRAARDADPRQLTKLFPWNPVVSVTLPANVALSHLGNQEGRTALLAAIESATLAELRFLLLVMRDLDAPELLHSLKRTLDDQRETGSGAPAGVEPVRRLCDDAVDAYVRRLQLPVTFSLSDAQRYTPEQIAAVRPLIDSTLPR